MSFVTRNQITPAFVRLEKRKKFTYSRYFISLKKGVLSVLLFLTFTCISLAENANTQTYFELTLDKSLLDFGYVEAGKTAQLQVILSHHSESQFGPIDILDASIDELDSQFFHTDFQGPVTLYPGESLPITVYYAARESHSGETIVNGTIFISHQGSSNLSMLKLKAQVDSVPEMALHNKNIATPSFSKSLLDGIGAISPTSLQFGPDGRLYASDIMGLIKVYTVQRFGENQYSVISTETLSQIKNIANHDDNGLLNPLINNRLVTGLRVTGSPDNPVIYVASSDPRIGGGNSHTNTGLDTNSTILSRLSWSGTQWQKTDLVRGLPRSQENHTGNGLALSEDGRYLYLAVGGNTNAGATSNNFALLPEYALSAAILQIDLLTIGDTTYDLPTLDDEDSPGHLDVNDPFGGNNGKNQAMLVFNGPVTVYAPGFRNPYDVLITQSGRMYSIDNGPNAGWGGIPTIEGPEGHCTNFLNEPGHSANDSLHYITGVGYYAGHPNPTRGNSSNTFNTTNPQSPVFSENTVECDYRMPGIENGALTTFPVSTNGLTEYTANNFAGAMQGDLLAAGWDNQITRIQLDTTGTVVVHNNSLFSNVGVRPLDVTALSDVDIFPGTVWVADFSGQSIYVFEPADYDEPQNVCIGNIAGDDDGDGFSNQDESLNNTDPCSAADVPPDHDGDSISDLLDQDDDNDGIDDLSDPFALDSLNGAGTAIPLLYDWENNSPSAAGILNLGFTGLMSNGEQDYLSLFNPQQMTASGAAGVLTIDQIHPGDAYKHHNSQHYGFQLGINVGPESPVFTVHTRVLIPFSGMTAKPHQSLGLFIGTGDQDNYIKLTANAVGSTGGIQLLKESNGGSINSVQHSDDIFGADTIDLYLLVDPAKLTVAASYQISKNFIAQPLVNIPKTMSIPLSWLNAKTKLAAGILSTSSGATAFPGTWDLFEVIAPLNDFESDNLPPQIQILSANTARVNTPFHLDALVTDNHLPIHLLDVVWTQLSGPNDIVFSDPTLPSGTAEFSTSGLYEIGLRVGDGINITEASLFVTVSTKPLHGSSSVRINVGGPTVQSLDGNWMSDEDLSDYYNAGEIYKTGIPVDVSALEHAVPEEVFQSQRWDASGGPEMQWSIPVTPGPYKVNLYFAETWSGAFANGKRVFSVEVEGQNLIAADIFAQAGKKKAIALEFVVNSDNVLNLTLLHETQNPFINAIEIIPLSDGANQPPIIDMDSVATTIVGTAYSPKVGVSDDYTSQGQLDINWSVVSAAGDVSISDDSTLEPMMVFSAPGDYLLHLNVSDGDLSAYAEVTVTVQSVLQTSLIRINAGGPEISDPSGNWVSDQSASAWVNTGNSYNQNTSIDLSQLDTVVPEALFKSERWDKGSAPEMSWSIPVTPGSYQVNLYFAEIWSGAFANGKRVFNVSIEGLSTSNIDVYAQVGGNTAVVYSSKTTADETLDISFQHIIQNPNIKAIEIVRLN